MKKSFRGLESGGDDGKVPTTIKLWRDFFILNNKIRRQRFYNK